MDLGIGWRLEMLKAESIAERRQQDNPDWVWGGVCGTGKEGCLEEHKSCQKGAGERGSSTETRKGALLDKFH